MTRQKMAWMKFYPSVWLSDAAARSCSMQARALWIDMMCIMYDAEPRGHLLIAGEPVDEKTLSRIVGESVDEVKSCLSELEKRGVFDRRKNGAIVCRRIEREEKNARKKRENGKKGAAARYGKQTENEGLLWQKSSTNHRIDTRSKNIDSIKRENISLSRDEMDALAKRVESVYPAKGWQPEGPIALNPAFARVLRDGATPDGLVHACREYARQRSDYPVKFSNFVSQGVWKAYPTPKAAEPVNLDESEWSEFLRECKADGADDAKIRTYSAKGAGLQLFEADGKQFVTVSDRPHEFQDAFGKTISRLGLQFVTQEFARKKQWI